MEKGYQLIKIHEVFHFTPENRRTGLFAEYFNTWLKLKQESAGWPADCDTEEKKAEYIRNYKEHEGIQLENVANNPGRKAFAKLLLNKQFKLNCIKRPHLTCSVFLHFKTGEMFCTVQPLKHRRKNYNMRTS